MNAAALELQELAPLLAPISAEQPSGASLRYADTFRLIEDARREDDASLPQGIWEQPLKRADWRQVEALCGQALAERSKDLQIAAWLCEAWVHLRGLDGLGAGLHLLRALVETYWDSVHPVMEDGDIEFRAGPFEWLNKNVAQAMLQLTLVEGRSAAGQYYRLVGWDAATRAAAAPPPPKGRAAAAAPSDQLTRAQFSAAAAQMPRGYYAALWDGIDRAGAALAQLAEALEQRMGGQAPLCGAIAARLEACYAAVQELAGERALNGRDLAALDSDDELEQEQEQDLERDQDDLARTPARQGRGGAIRSRDDAYRQLDEAADYLLRTEPHSPVPYLVKRAIGWGAMPLAELLQELLDNESDLKQIYRLLGTAGH